MADKIKKVSKYSEDAIKLVINQMPEDDRKGFEKYLTQLESTLGEKEKKKPKTSKMLNDETIFRNSFLPQLERKVKEIEAMELQGRNCTINVKFDVKTNFEGLDGNQMKSEHTKVLAIESGLQSLTLIAQFSRGLLYITLSRMAKSEGQNWKSIVTNELGVSSMTAMRYMTLSSIIANFPRLLMCEVSFTQVLKHKNKLLKYLKSEEGRDLESALSIPIEIRAQKKKLMIDRTILEVPMMKFATDPDYLYRDSVSKETVPDAEWATASPVNEEEELADVLALCDVKLEH